MKITLNDLLGNQGLIFTFESKNHGRVQGRVHSITVPGKVTMKFATGEGMQHETLKTSEVKLTNGSDYRRTLIASVMSIKGLELSDTEDINEQFTISIGNSAAIFGSAIYKTLEMYANEGADVSFNFGMTDSKNVVIIPVHDGSGEFVINPETRTVEDDFSGVIAILKDRWGNLEKMLEYSKTELKLDRIPITTSFSIQTGENYVPFIGFNIQRDFARQFENWFMKQAARTMGSPKSKKSGGKSIRVEKTRKNKLID
jgi:hypothetical protein